VAAVAVAAAVAAAATAAAGRSPHTNPKPLPRGGVFFIPDCAVRSNTKKLPFDDPPLAPEQLADPVSVVALDLDVGVGRLATAAAASFELTDNILEECAVAGQTLNHGHGLALASRLLDAEAGGDPVGDGLVELRRAATAC